MTGRSRGTSPSSSKLGALGGPEAEFVIDGEIVVLTPPGNGCTFDFAALLARLHPAPSRVARLARETPAVFVAFDLLAEGRHDLRAEGFGERRRRLAALLSGAPPPIYLTPATGDPEMAAGWLDHPGGGVDGVVVKSRNAAYQAGARTMVKVKHERTADCVVAGYRLLGDRPVLSSLLLGVYDDTGTLHHVGVAGGFSEKARAELLGDLVPHAVGLGGHPWQHGFGLGPSPLGRLQGAAGRWTPDLVLDWMPLRPELVAEVAYNQLDGDRFRHPARFRRWRPDREARSCTFEQLETKGPVDARALLLPSLP